MILYRTYIDVPLQEGSTCDVGSSAHSNTRIRPEVTIKQAASYNIPTKQDYLPWRLNNRDYRRQIASQRRKFLDLGAVPRPLRHTVLLSFAACRPAQLAHAVPVDSDHISGYPRG